MIIVRRGAQLVFGVFGTTALDGLSLPLGAEEHNLSSLKYLVHKSLLKKKVDTSSSNDWKQRKHAPEQFPNC